MKAITVYNNFARGKADRDLNGRFDLPIYRSSLEIYENWISDFKGNAIFSAGFEEVFLFEDCAFIEFKFSTSQNYLCVFYLNKIRFLSYDGSGNLGWVLSGGTPLEVSTPYTLSESKRLRFTQSEDSLIVTHLDKGYPPYKLKRTSASAFSFNTYARLNDPFALTFDASKAITAITQAASAQLTITAHSYVVGDNIKLTSISGMTELNDWTAAVSSVVDVNNITIDVDTTDFTAYSSGGTAERVATSMHPAQCLFYKGRLYYANTQTKITTIWASVAGSFYDHTKTPVDVSSALEFTPSEISEEILWLFGGDNSMFAGASDGIIPVNGGGVGQAITAESITADLSSLQPCNDTYPYKKDGNIFYVGVDGRNLYAFSYDLLSEAFEPEDMNFVSYDITDDGISKIRHVKDKYDLMFMHSGDGLLSSNISKKEGVIGWHDRSTDGSFNDIGVIKDNDGVSQLFVLAERNGAFYIEIQSKYKEFSIRDSFITALDASDANRTSLRAAKLTDYEAYNRKVAEELKESIHLDSSLIVSNLQSNLITFDGTDTITATAGIFVAGDVGKHIVYKTDTGYESGRFEITAYTSATVVTVDVLQTPTQNTYTDWYLTFDTVSGLSKFNTYTVAVVTDGGYLSDFTVASGTIDLSDQVTHAVIGYKYVGVGKTFALGFPVGADNTQFSMKAISRVGVRAIATAGLLVGTDRYRMEPVQTITPDTLNYLPPIPIDGTKFVQYTDDHKEDKNLYFIQDKPLPAKITCIMVNAKYAVGQ